MPSSTRANQITTESVNGAQVAVDFSIPSVTESNVHALLDAGVDVVVGTTGWTEESYARVREHAEAAGRAVLIAPNFAMGAVLAMKFAAMAAPYFESAEVIEMHHPAKVDAPSGTAVATARGIAKARAEAGLGEMPDATETDELGSRGGRVDGIPVHAVRLRGLTASEEILLGNAGEQLVIRTDSFDRVSFMPGVLLGVRRVSRPYGPDDRPRPGDGPVSSGVSRPLRAPRSERRRARDRAPAGASAWSSLMGENALDAQGITEEALARPVGGNAGRPAARRHRRSSSPSTAIQSWASRSPVPTRPGRTSATPRSTG